MFEKAFILQNVDGVYKLNNDKLLITINNFDNPLHFIFDNQGLNRVEKGLAWEEILLLNTGDILFSDVDSNIYISNGLFNNSKKLFDQYYLVPSDNSQKYFLLQSQEDGKNTIFSSENFSPLWKSNSLTSIIDEFIYTSAKYHPGEDPKNIFKRLNPVDGSSIWNLDLSQYYGNGTVNFYDVRKDILFLKPSIANSSMAFGISNSTGKVLWSVDNFNMRSFQIHHSEDKLIALHHNYEERSLQTGNIIFKHDDEDFFKDFYPKRGSANFCQLDNYLITVVPNNNKIYMYNTKTYNFDWIYTDSEVRSFLPAKDILYKNDHLFMRDIDNQLHIYKTNSV